MIFDNKDIGAKLMSKFIKQAYPENRYAEDVKEFVVAADTSHLSLRGGLWRLSQNIYDL